MCENINPILLVWASVITILYIFVSVKLTRMAKEITRLSYVEKDFNVKKVLLAMYEKREWSQHAEEDTEEST